MAVDFREHIQQAGDWSWIDREIARLGSEDAFYKLRGEMLLQISNLDEAVFSTLLRLPLQTAIMFIKICCEWLLLPGGANYRFSADITK
jgi:hypothetical protein